MTADVITALPAYDAAPSPLALVPAYDVPAYDVATTTLVLVPAASALLARQQVFVSDGERLLRKAACSGQRLVTALFHIFTAHAPVLVETAGQQVYYVCCECRRDDRGPADPYPCPTAREAAWALDAVLH